MKQLFQISALSLSLIALALTSATAADLAIYSGPHKSGLDFTRSCHRECRNSYE